MCANIPERFRSRDTIICGEFALFRFKSSQRKFSWAPAFYGDDRGSCLMATENHLGSTQTRESSVGTNLLKAVCDDDDDAMAWHLIGHAVHVLWRANFLLFHFFFFCFRRVFFHFYSFIICSSSMFGFFFFSCFRFLLNVKLNLCGDSGMWNSFYYSVAILCHLFHFEWHWWRIRYIWIIIAYVSNEAITKSPLSAASWLHGWLAGPHCYRFVISRYVCRCTAVGIVEIRHWNVLHVHNRLFLLLARATSTYNSIRLSWIEWKMWKIKLFSLSLLSCENGWTELLLTFEWQCHSSSSSSSTATLSSNITSNAN